jgi:Flp pilus assembly secretin CpaC
MIELPLTKLREAGFEFAKLPGPAGAKDETSVLRVIESLKKEGLIKVLAEPTLATVSGRPATFKCGGQFPISLPSADGSEPAHYQDYGTEVHLLPTVLNGETIRLAIRARISELDPERAVAAGDHAFPGLSVRQADTIVEVESGKTVVLGRLVQVRETGESGCRTKESYELMILATPRIVRPAPPQVAHPVPPRPIRAAVRPRVPKSS